MPHRCLKTFPKLHSSRFPKYCDNHLSHVQKHSDDTSIYYALNVISQEVISLLSHSLQLLRQQVLFTSQVLLIFVPMTSF